VSHSRSRIFTIALAILTSAPAALAASSARLRFDNGRFRILQFTDTHMEDEGASVCALMERIARSQQPDLIILTGDIMHPPNRAMTNLKKTMARLDVPWLVTLGNHDAEVQRRGPKPREDRDARMRMFEEFEISASCLNRDDRRGTNKRADQVLIVQGKNGRSEAAIFALDSGSYAKRNEKGKYAYIERSQIAWFEETSRNLRRWNRNVPLPALAFFHIPLPEYDDAWKAGRVVGTKKEKCCPSEINSGMFAAMARNKNVMGVFVGHDHENNFVALYKGIALCYGQATGGYGSLPMGKGGRVVELREGQRSFTTWVVNGRGEVFDRVVVPADLERKTRR